MKFSELAEYFERLERTASRLEMTEILAELCKQAGEAEVEMVVNLSLGQLRPKFNRLEFNLAEKMVMRALAEGSGKRIDEIKSLYKSVGDLGEVWIRLKGKAKRKTGKTEVSVEQVYEKLVKIAKEEGQGSQERKVGGLASLLENLDGLSGKYVVRIVAGKLRLGFSDMTILDALSWMVKGDKSLRGKLERVYQLQPDIGKLARMIRERGVKKLEETIDVELGIPVVPALAQRLKTADQMIEKMGKVAVEPKFDGTRVQIHFCRTGKNGSRWHGGTVAREGEWFAEEKVLEVRTFTRNLDETTDMFPEIQGLGEWVEADELILDSEAVGFDPETRKMLPFQETIKRKRKHGVGKAAVDIPLQFHVFDVLYKDGKSMIREPFYRRRRVLEQTVKNSRLVEVPELMVTDNPEELRKKHAQYLEEGFEGALVKKWDGVYEPGRRGWNWVKFKEAEDAKAKLSDTVDAVVMGLYVGRGKRAGFGVGAFLIGVRGERGRQATSGGQRTLEEGKFYTVTKVGTGLSDEQWVELKKRSRQFEVKKKPKEYEVDRNLVPDVWLAPGLVVEIAADEVTRSPIHTAGLALRFPRLVRFRDDKGVGEVTSVGELEQIGG